MTSKTIELPKTKIFSPGCFGQLCCVFRNDMPHLLSAAKDVKKFFFLSYQYPQNLTTYEKSSSYRFKNFSGKGAQLDPLQSFMKERDAVVWRLLRLEERVDVENLAAYWEIMDQLMDLSLRSAIVLLQNLYEYRVRKLRPEEKQREYPDIPNDLYRLEYDDEQSVSYRDVCAQTLLNEALDLLQAEAERLVRR